MNRLLYILLISAITIVGFTMFQHKDMGHINVSFAGHSFETNLLVFGAAVLCVLFAFLVLIKSWQLIRNAFLYIGNQRKKRLSEKARLSLSQGLTGIRRGTL